jgi:hypothetical protein
MADGFLSILGWLQGPKDCRVKTDRRDQRAIPVQLVKWDHQDLKDQKVKPDPQDPKDHRAKLDLRDPKGCRVERDRPDRRAIRVQLAKRDPKALEVLLVRLGQPLDPRRALLPHRTAQLCAMEMRFWSRSSARRGRRLVQPVRREARRQVLCCGSNFRSTGNASLARMHYRQGWH